MAATVSAVLERTVDMGPMVDATRFLQARTPGFTPVTANVADVDRLRQMQPEGRVLFYERV